MFGLVQIIIPLHARKPYLKPWLQQTRGSDRERSPTIFSSEKKSPRHGGEMLCWVPTFCGLCFFQSCKKKRVHKKWGLWFFLTAFPLHVWDSVFFQSWNFWTSLSVTSSCMLEPGYGYGFLACNGIMICTRPNILKTLLRKRATKSIYWYRCIIIYLGMDDISRPIFGWFFRNQPKWPYNMVPSRPWAPLVGLSNLYGGAV